MRAVLGQELTRFDGLVVEKVPPPEPERGEVRIPCAPSDLTSPTL
jgi:hypothetical protein